MSLDTIYAVSYTHLDVYKRQVYCFRTILYKSSFILASIAEKRYELTNQHSRIRANFHLSYNILSTIQSLCELKNVQMYCTSLDVWSTKHTNTVMSLKKPFKG